MPLLLHKPLNWQGNLAAMQDNIASDLNCEATQINIKATTTERLGFCGREEGMAAHAVVLVIQS